nr:2-dehydro-3-deoxygalactonokinase [Lysobacter sp. M2-1]
MLAPTEGDRFVIAVDWGSSNLRAYRLGADGTILEQRRADLGVLSCDGRFAEVLARQLDGWDDTRVMMCGMIGGRGGWMEVPYVECPAGEREIAAAIVALEGGTPALAERELLIVPGMIDQTSSEVADVMRGEETQIIGLLDRLGDGDHTVCLPGTHSKWVDIRGSNIVSVQTTMTGEAYALFRNQSVLARLMAADEPPLHVPAFDEGLRRSGDAGGLLHHLFGVRTMALLGRLSRTQSPSYLSGLLIGHELRGQDPHPSRVHLIGNDRLQVAYARALEVFGIQVQRHSEDLAAAGLHRLAMVKA